MLIWKVNASSARTASYRYRCLFPSRYLVGLGYPSVIYERSERVYCAPRAAALVFMKSFTHEDIQICQRAVSRGIPVVLDLCDNIFIEEYAQGRKLDYVPRENFRAMARLAAAIVTTGPALKQVIQDAVEDAPPVWVIPDGCETLEDMQKSLAMGDWQRGLGILRHSPRGSWNFLESQGRQLVKSLTQNLKRQARRLLRHGSVETGDGTGMATQVDGSSGSFLTPSTPARGLTAGDSDSPSTEPPKSWGDRKTVLWFGNQGTSYGQAGMANVLAVSPALHELNQQIPLGLKIVSNSYSKYLKLIQPLPFPTQYVEWHPLEVYHHIATSDVVIIPNSKSPFSICKSANRATLALSLGVPVVATETPALQPLQDCLLFDDWASGLRQYLTQPELVTRHIQQAQAVIESTYSGAAIAKQWAHLLDELQQQRYGQPEAASHPRRFIQTPGAKGFNAD